MTTLVLPVDSGYGSSSQEMVMEPIAQDVGQTIVEIIGSIREFISHTTTWNKHQCKRLADRVTAIGERFSSMDWDRNIDELIKLLHKGKNLVLGCKASKDYIANVVSRTNNPEGFEEWHEEFDTLEAKSGLQDLGKDMEFGMQNMKSDAEKDKEEMPGIFSQMQISAPLIHAKKLLQVVSEKTKDVDVKKLVESGEALPSYLSIDLKSDIVIKHKPIRPYVRRSEQDPLEQIGWVVVHSGTWLGCDFAIKVFKCGAKDGRAAAWNGKQLLMEVGSLVELQHPHVVRLVGFGQNEEESIFVMELMHGNLRTFMETKLENSTPKIDKPFTASEELDIINQIAKGMYFIYTKGYAHGDLKCSNIVYKKYDQYLEVKLSDLRGSQKLDKAWDAEAFEQSSKTRRPRWTAPEAIDYYGGVQPSRELLLKSDVYSFGMICYEIVTGKFPFHKMFKGLLLERIQEGAAKWNELPLELDEGLKGLITSCWNKEPLERPTFDQICHLLDTIRSRKLVGEKIMSCGGKVAAMWSQVKQIPIGVQSLFNKRPKVELLRSKSIISAPEYLNILPNQLKRLEDIGIGSFGKVYKATWLNCTFAVKILKIHLTTLDLQKEVDFLMKVSRHPCIIQMVGLSQNLNGEYSIVMEYMNGTLKKLIETRMKKPGTIKPFTPHEEVLIITTIAWGMAYLHSRGLVHRDLSTVNVLAQDYCQTVDVKIVDFGKSHLEDSSHGYYPKYYEGVGASCFRAPEMLPISEQFNEELPAELPNKCAKVDLDALKATDVYSFAMICYQVLTGHNPCSGKIAATNYAEMRKHRPKWLHVNGPDAKLKLLVEQCWNMAPTKRPTFKDICWSLRNQFQNQLAS